MGKMIRSNPYLFSQSSHSLIPYISHQYLARQRGDLWKVGALSLNILHSWSQSCLFLLAKNGGYHGYAVCRVSGWWFQAVVVLSMGWSLDQNDVDHHPQPVMKCSPLPSAIVSAMCTVLIIYKTHMHKWLIVIYGYAMKLHELASRSPGKRGQSLFGTRICLVCATHGIRSNIIAFSLEHIYTILAKKMKLLLKTVLWCLKSHPQGLWWVKSHVNVNTFDLLEEPQHSCAFFSAPNGQALHSGQVSLDEGTHHPLMYVLPAPCSRRLHGAGQPAALGNAVQIMEGLWNPSPFKNPLSLKFFDACWSFFSRPLETFYLP